MIKHALRAALAATALLSSLAQAADAPTLPPVPPADVPTNTVPEPGSVALAGMALAGLLVARQRRQQRVKPTRAQD